MKVLKFGGTSVSGGKNIQKVITILKQNYDPKSQMIVVVSALSGVTDSLLELANLAHTQDQTKYQSLLTDLENLHLETIKDLTSGKLQQETLKKVEELFSELKNVLTGINLLKELSKRSLDLVLSFGERFSSYIIAQAILEAGLECDFIDSRELIVTDSNYGEALVDKHLTYQKIKQKFENNAKLSVMGGFIAKDKNGIITTLGRGGSDYTASLVGAGIDAQVIEIWTDVEGVFSADPRIVKQAFAHDTISYKEAAELAHFGAKVIHPKTMQPAQEKNIPIDIKNTFKPHLKGTRITKDNQHKYLIKGISTRKNITLLNFQTGNDLSITTIAKKIFSILDNLNIQVLITTQASHEQSLSIGVASEVAKFTKQNIEKLLKLEIQAGHFLPIELTENLSIIAIVGEQMKGVPGISSRFFRSLSKIILTL